MQMKRQVCITIFFRYYDAHCGRFTQQDPIGLQGGINLYYFGANTTAWVDPLGLAGEGILVNGARATLAWIATDTAIPEPTDMALLKWIGYGIAGTMAAGVIYISSSNSKTQSQTETKTNTATCSGSKCQVNRCPPCVTTSGRVIQPKTLGYRPLDVIPDDVKQHGVYGSHHNIFEANQMPFPKCDCFWAKQKYVLKPEQLTSQMVPVEPFVNR